MAGAVADRPARLVAAHEPIDVAGPRPRFVSRGGEKLAAALDHFAIAVEGRRALDAGASTGGFTDCLLQAGARRVVAVDVGRGQLHERIRDDPRVAVHERTNIRHFRLSDAGDDPFDLVVADLSFMSLVTATPALLGLAARGADVAVLVKPQFEAGRRQAARARGVIRDPEEWSGALLRVGAALEAGGATMMGAMVSPLRGADGNVEFFVHCRATASPLPADGLDARLGLDEALVAGRRLAEGAGRPLAGREG